MTRFHVATLFAVAAVAIAYLAATPPAWPWIAIILALYVLIVAWGVMSLRAQLFCDAVWRSKSGRAEVALTFDDGPDAASTPLLLDLLKKEGVAATFFVVGENVRREPELVRRCHNEGHLVENHSDRHAWYTNFLSKRAMTREVAACSAGIKAITGANPRYFRPPIGLSNPATGPAAAHSELIIVGWQVRGLDGRRSDPDAVVRRVLKQVKAGGIILLHDGGRDPNHVVAITRGVLEGLSRKGLSPVRLDTLLAAQAS